ncbi:glucose-6-phosphate isomerase [Soehngenia longivitae]|uniref:Glucose-6-phosphate isomerase n=1 Tax=Soehngenia longivitae TaxID=2562294 RepID=A0A4Z0D2V5_9FIRM|nr:glucose-6-phosphate isomerase [Soehngenia longivitae]TFZ39658.1 glucose-6-phosphate isomerase [Soehngenia longivitae]
MGIRFNHSNSFITEHEYKYMENQIRIAHKMLHDRTAQGSEFTGWLDLSLHFDHDEYHRLLMKAEEIRNNADYLIVIGIGGSYLGARAVIEALNHSFYNLIEDDKRSAPKILFAGNNLSGKYLSDLFEIIKDKEVYVNVISKSGTTTEPAIAFRFFKKFMEDKYGKEGAKKRIIATTDKSRGSLKELANINGYETFVIPDDIGGRYSVLTPVGLLPIAVSNINTDEILKGAFQAEEIYTNENLFDNECYMYAASRQILNRKGKDIEILTNYEPSLSFVSEWWKQLYGESEGKDKKGIYPASVNFTTDLHSMGQWIQDGKRNIFETNLIIKELNKDLTIGYEDMDLDKLNYLSGKTVSYVNEKAFEGTLEAHVKGDVPNLVIELDRLDEYNMGSLIYFFEKACAISGYIQGINPFDQPGVEMYKKNMFKLLGKPE